MTLKLVSFDSENKVLFAEARRIRSTVFIEEQGVPENIEYDTFEKISKHYLLFSGDQAIGTCRWRETPHGIKLERFAILAEFRRSGSGSFLVKQILKEVILLNKPVYLHAQEQVVGFYAGLGFEMSGKAFVEAGIKHYLMIFNGLVPKTAFQSSYHC